MSFSCSAPVQRPASLAVIGHSFVRRLGEFVEGRHLPLSQRSAHQSKYVNLRLSGETVAFFGLGGAKLSGSKSIFSYLSDWIGPLRFKAVYFEMGSNDLCDPIISAETVARYILSAANFLVVGYEVKTVIVGQVTIRRCEPYPGYNKKVKATNACLKYLINQRGDNSIMYASLRGLIKPELEKMFHSDGIHLSHMGNTRLTQGVRGAFIRALRKR